MKKLIFKTVNLILLLLITAVILTSPFVFAQESSIVKVVNEVLFHLQKKAYTSVDLKQFGMVRMEVVAALNTDQQLILKGLSDHDAFVLYTICQIEADALDLNISAKQQAQFDLEKRPWKAGVFKANIYLQTKENLFNDRERFNSWFQMLKNKYDYLKKNNSVSN